MKPFDKKISSSGLILDISSMRNFARKLIGKGKRYDDLLEFLVENNYYYDEDIPIPQIKEIQEHLNIPYTKLRKQLLEIYNDLIDSAYDDGFHFNELEYFFSMSYLGEYLSLTIKNLPVAPRVGENIEIPFFKEKLGTRSFHVESIEHELDDGKQCIYVRLKYGRYNRFWDIRKGEADLKREFTFEEQMEFDDFDKKKKLGFFGY